MVVAVQSPFGRRQKCRLLLRGMRRAPELWRLSHQDNLDPGSEITGSSAVCVTELAQIQFPKESDGGLRVSASETRIGEVPNRRPTYPGAGVRGTQREERMSAGGVITSEIEGDSKKRGNLGIGWMLPVGTVQRLNSQGVFLECEGIHSSFELKLTKVSRGRHHV